MKTISKRFLHVLVPAAAALTLGAGEPVQADSFSLYFGGPGTFFGYDSGHRSHGYRHGYRPYYYKRRHAYKHYYGGPYRGWSSRRHWRGHHYYQPRRHHYWQKRQHRYWGHR
jgi:hypothetical protein